ncbi:SGNH/GDSL hydrolase family protein [Flexithrix dorotheae]|uniref:SGNH/GDSL hydrolase family protein n=1 Tax=Flexithrix dorotheae TaxID=70993 RepID=UPI0003721114|nr:SGNH/GDSL hydrolase family protein [Flexithrix dorotheae]
MKAVLLFFILIISFQFTKSDKTALFLGDSLTAGDGVDKALTFSARVGQNFEGLNSINLGRSGWPTTAYLKRWDEVTQKFPKQADFIFMQLGANDLRVDGHSDEVVQQCAVNMKEILKRLEEIYPQAQIILMSSTKIDYTQMNEQIRNANFGAHTNEYINSIGKKYKKLAKSEDYGFIDLYQKVPIHSTHDGAHLTEEGHAKVADIIIKYLESYSTGY